MKATILFLTLLALQTGHAQEMNCTAVNAPFKGLKVTLIQPDLVKAQLTGEAVEQIFVGSLIHTPVDLALVKTFELYNQYGEAFELNLKQQLNFPSHCRARVCPPSFESTKTIAKLSAPEMSDEYYKCL